MDVWPQRERFRELLESYKKTHKKRQIEVADDLGVSLHTLRAVLYYSQRKPGFDFVQRAARLFGCSITELVDDPGTGTDQDASDVDRFILAAIQRDLAKMTDAQKQAALENWRLGIRLISGV